MGRASIVRDKVGGILGAATHLSTRYWKVLFLAMLVLLHFAVLRGVEDSWARALMLAHFGLFMIWQPFLQGDHRLRMSTVVVILLAALVILLGLNWWLLGLWVATFAGLVGGKVFIFQRRWMRAFYLLVLLYLVALLLLWIVPNGFLGSRTEPAVKELAKFGLFGLFAVMAVLPVESDTAEPQIVDLFYATLIFLLLLALVLGGFAFMTVGEIGYGLALVYTLLTLAGVLLFISLVWNPRAGFTGLSVFFSRYLLSVGLPLEQWLHFLAEISRSEAMPDQFLRKACQGLGRLQWVTGGTWRTGANESDNGKFGEPARYSVDFKAPELSVSVYSRLRPSPSLVWHFNVLGRLIAQFYVGKQREVKLKQQSYVQAVHETGARLTHDVKNLLQSLNVLCSAAASTSGDPNVLNAMIRRHLPVVTQRLQHTLDKLQRPTVETGRFIRPEVWWEGLQNAYRHPAVSFDGAIENDAAPVPRDLFETAADNLINNAVEKRKSDPNVVVRVYLSCARKIVFSVTDTGKPVTADIAQALFQGPVPSETGYGIGLFQLSRQADVTGYQLRLAANEPGNVRFELSNRSSATIGGG